MFRCTHLRLSAEIYSRRRCGSGDAPRPPCRRPRAMGWLGPMGASPAGEGGVGGTEGPVAPPPRHTAHGGGGVAAWVSFVGLSLSRSKLKRRLRQEGWGGVCGEEISKIGVLVGTTAKPQWPSRIPTDNRTGGDKIQGFWDRPKYALRDLKCEQTVRGRV